MIDGRSVDGRLEIRTVFVKRKSLDAKTFLDRMIETFYQTESLRVGINRKRMYRLSDMRRSQRKSGWADAAKANS